MQKEMFHLSMQLTLDRESKRHLRSKKRVVERKRLWKEPSNSPFPRAVRKAGTSLTYPQKLLNRQREVRFSYRSCYNNWDIIRKKDFASCEGCTLQKTDKITQAKQSHDGDLEDLHFLGDNPQTLVKSKVEEGECLQKSIRTIRLPTRGWTWMMRLFCQKQIHHHPRHWNRQFRHKHVSYKSFIRKTAEDRILGCRWEKFDRGG